MQRSRLWFGGGVLVVAIHLLMPAARAETPANSLVMANQIDDMITLDPAEVFEFTAAEWAANVYDRLITYPPDDVEDIQGHVAESWEIADDGRTYTFKVRDGITFHSGNPLARRGRRLVLAAGGQAQQDAGLHPHPVRLHAGQRRAEDQGDRRSDLHGRARQALRADLLPLLPDGDRRLGGRQGAGPPARAGRRPRPRVAADQLRRLGPLPHVAWKPNESWTLEKNPDYWKGEVGFERVITRHIAEPSTQMLLLEKGDIDIARNLEGDQAEALRDNEDVVIREVPKGAIYYLGLNQKNEHLARPEVRQALKYLVDYDGIVATIMKGSATVHQAFLPVGMLGASQEKPFRLDVEKAKDLLRQAGLEDGFKVTMDTRNTSPVIDIAQVLQGTWAQAGIDLEILPGDNKQTLTKYRARTHDIYIGRWGPDYQDPHTNADTFTSNPDNEGDHSGKLAWRNAWDIPELTAKTAAAVLEQDAQKRAQMYEELQREVQERGPFVIMFQDIELIALRANVEGMIWGPSFDDNRYWQGRKG